MTSNLSWCSCHHDVSRNAPPISLAEFAQSDEEQPVTEGHDDMIRTQNDITEVYVKGPSFEKSKDSGKLKLPK